MLAIDNWNKNEFRTTNTFSWSKEIEELDKVLMMSFCFVSFERFDVCLKVEIESFISSFLSSLNKHQKNNEANKRKFSWFLMKWNVIKSNRKSNKKKENQQKIGFRFESKLIDWLSSHRTHSQSNNKWKKSNEMWSLYFAVEWIPFPRTTANKIFTHEIKCIIWNFCQINKMR